MTICEFESYLQKGLGRAILLLRKEPDKTPFREAVLRYIAPENNNYNNGVDYKLDLLSCFEDSDVLKKETAEQILHRVETFGGYCDIPFLIALGYQKEFTEIVEANYRTYRLKLLALTEDDECSGETTDICTRFLQTAVKILRYTQVTQERIRAMLPDLIHYFSLPEKWNIYFHDAAMLRERIEPYWDNDTEALLREIASLPRGERLVKEMMKWETEPPNPNITAEEILSRLPLDSSDNGYCSKSFCLASTEVIEKIAETMLTTGDIAIRSDLLSLFLDSKIIDGKIHNPPAFPFPEWLIALVDVEELWELEASMDEEDLWMIDVSIDDKRDFYVNKLLPLLNIMCHPQLSALGKLLRDPSHRYDAYGWMLMGNNYTVEDRDELLEVLTTESADIENGAGRFYLALYAFLCAAKKGASDLPLHILPSFWEHLFYGGWRMEVAEVLLMYGMMPDDIREECFYDRSKAIRNLIRNN